MRGFILGVPFYFVLYLGTVACQQWTSAPLPSHIAEEGGDLRVSLSGVNVSYVAGDSFYLATLSVSFSRPVLGLRPEMFALSDCIAETAIGNSKSYTLTIRCDDLNTDVEVYLPMAQLQSISGYSNLRSNTVLITGPTF